MRRGLFLLWFLVAAEACSADVIVEPCRNVDRLTVELRRLPERLRGSQGDRALVELLRLLDEHGADLVPIDETYRVPVRRVLVPLLADMPPELRRRYERLTAGPAQRALLRAEAEDYRCLARSRPAVPAALVALRSAAVRAAQRGNLVEAAACLEELREHAFGAGRGEGNFVSRLLEAVLSVPSQNREPQAVPEPPWKVVRVRIEPGMSEPFVCGDDLLAIRRDRLCRLRSDDDSWHELPLPPNVLRVIRCETTEAGPELFLDAQASEGRMLLALATDRIEQRQRFALRPDARPRALLATAQGVFALLDGPDREVTLTMWGRDGEVRWSVPVLRASAGQREQPPLRLIPSGNDVVLVESGGLCIASAVADGSPLWARQFPKSPMALQATAEHVVFATGEELICCAAGSGAERWRMPLPSGGRILGTDRNRIYVTANDRLRGLRAYALRDGSTQRPHGWFLHLDGGLRTSGQGDLRSSVLAWPTLDGIFVLDAATGDPLRQPIRVRAAWVRLTERTLFWSEQSLGN